MECLFELWILVERLKNGALCLQKLNVGMEAMEVGKALIFLIGFFIRNIYCTCDADSSCHTTPDSDLNVPKTQLRQAPFPSSSPL